VILVVGLRSALLPPPVESPNTLTPIAVLKESGTVVAQILKAGFIYNFCSEDLGIADLHRVFGRRSIVAGLRQHKAADAGVLLRVTVVLIAGRKRVVGADLVVNPRAKVGAGMGVGTLWSNAVGWKFVPRIVASTTAISSMLRRWTSKKNDAFLLIGPPMLPWKITESYGACGASPRNGLRVFRPESFPRRRTVRGICPSGLVKISMRP